MNENEVNFLLIGNIKQINPTARACGRITLLKGSTKKKVSF
jgi:hypothetical protein